MYKWRSCDCRASGSRDTASEGRGSIRSMWRHLGCLRLCTASAKDLLVNALVDQPLHQCKSFLLLRNAMLGLKNYCSRSLVKLFHWDRANQLWLKFAGYAECRYHAALAIAGLSEPPKFHNAFGQSYQVSQTNQTLAASAGVGWIGVWKDLAVALCL